MNNEERSCATRKPLEEMNVIDDFLFDEIMSDEKRGLEVCRIILSTVLDRKIGEIHFTPQKTVPGASEKSHGIRMDAYITERKEPDGSSNADINVYDIEPDKKSAEKEWLPRRSRYYGDLIDSKLLDTGVDYDKLPELVTIFILSYDPFGFDQMYYEVNSFIKEHPEVPYNDGIRRIYLYIGGELPKDAGKGVKKLRNLLKYIGKSTAENITDDYTKKLDEIVAYTKSRKDVGVRYMKSWEWEKEIRKEVTEEIKKEDSIIIEAERERADKAEAELAKYKAKFGEIA